MFSLLRPLIRISIPLLRISPTTETSPHFETPLPLRSSRPQHMSDPPPTHTHLLLSRTWVCLGRAPVSSSTEDVSPSAGRSTGVWTGCATAFLIKLYTILSGLGLLGGSLSQYPIGYIHISRAPNSPFPSWQSEPAPWQTQLITV